MKLKDYCSKIGSGATPRGGKNSYKDVGIPLIRSQNVHDWSFRESGLAFINEEQADALCSASVLKNDVLVNITGDSVARSCIVPDWLVPARVNQHVAIIRPTPALNSTYLLAFLQAQRPLLLKLASSGATRNALTKSMLEELDVTFPPLPIQEKVAHFIGSIQSKIVLNSRINDHLGELLSIEFDRLLRGATQRKLLIDVMDVLSGGTPKTSNPEYWVGGNIPLFSPRDATESPYVLETEKSITEEGLNNCNSALYPANTVFLTARGTVGKIVLAGKPMAMNQSCFALHGRTIPQSVVYQAIRNTISALKLKANGATFAAINTRDLRSETLILPTPEDVDWYDSFAKPIWASILANESECCRLRETRDALLPKLMSGEVDVSRIDLKQLNGHLSES